MNIWIVNHIWLLAEGFCVITNMKLRVTNQIVLVLHFICRCGALHKHPLWGVVRKRCSENMQQIYRRTPTLKCNFGCSPVNLLHIFRTPFPRTSEGLLLALLPKAYSTLFQEELEIECRKLKVLRWNTLKLR